MIESGHHFIEEVTVVGVVVVEDDHELMGLVRQKLADPAVVGHVYLESDAEHLLVPGVTGVDIGNGEGDVGQLGAGDGWPSDGPCSRMLTGQLMTATAIRARYAPARSFRAAAQSPLNDEPCITARVAGCSAASRSIVAGVLGARQL